ncbi:MAG: hypothetical protein IKR25_09875 [Muribaculaceae bacterium]|nr:hypothetical protein [Muribaculaceae bacterium]
MRLYQNPLKQNKQILIFSELMMKHYVNLFAAVLLAVLSLSLAGCGGDKDDEPDGTAERRKKELVCGTVTVDYEKSGAQATKYASMCYVWTDASGDNMTPIASGYKGYLRFQTYLYDYEDIQKAQAELDDWNDMEYMDAEWFDIALGSALIQLTNNSVGIDFHFYLDKDGQVTAGKKINIDGFYWDSTMGTDGEMTYDYDGTITVKSITKDRITLKFENVTFGIRTSWELFGNSKYDNITINGEISYNQPGNDWFKSSIDN